jgi:hypothetical protein
MARSSVVILGFTIILAVAACSAPGTSSSGGGGGPTGTPTGAPTGTGTGMPPPSGAAVALPFAVSAEFVPSGFMGDSPADFNAVKMSPDASKCPARDPSAKGACYSIDWTPSFLAGAKSAWVGVYWQYPANNWGGKAGKAIGSGATKVTFLAKGAAGGEALTFLTGGINAKGGDPTLTFSDSFSAKTDVTLTTSWTRYEVPLMGQTYSSVIGAFGWSMTTSAMAAVTSVTFYVDDIAWE